MKNLIKKSFKNSASVTERLVFAVNEQMGGSLQEYAADIANHGIDGGFSGFIYYSETAPFAENTNTRQDIIKLLEEQAQEFGQEVSEMVAGFGVFRRDKMSETDRRDLYRYLSETSCKETKIPNIMAWFAAEEAARYINDLSENN